MIKIFNFRNHMRKIKAVYYNFKLYSTAAAIKYRNNRVHI